MLKKLHRHFYEFNTGRHYMPFSFLSFLQKINQNLFVKTINRRFAPTGFWAIDPVTSVFENAASRSYFFSTKTNNACI